MLPLVIVENQDGRWAHALSADSAPADTWSEPLSGVRILLDTDGEVASFIVKADPGTRVYHSLWFAWYAHHPGMAFPG